MAAREAGAAGAGPDRAAGAGADRAAGAGADRAAGAGADRAAGAGPDRSPDGVVKLVLWRHGRTAWNAERRFQGHSDVPLDETGHAQARDAARYLAAMRPAAIFSSDLARAAETAGYLGELTGLPVQLDKDLRERGGGAWEGLTDAEIRAGYPEAYATFVPPDGEPVSAVAERAAAAMRRVAEGLRAPGTPGPAGPGADGGPGGGGRQWAGSLAVLVSHGAAISLGIARLLGLPERARLLGPLGNCCWSVLGLRSGHWRLLEHNVGQLPDLAPEPVQVLAAGPEEETSAVG